MNPQNTTSEKPFLRLIPDGEATAIMPVGEGCSPVTVIGTEAIRQTFDAATLRQTANSRLAPGVTRVVLNPDAHVGYGTPIGCVMVSPTHIYPGPVGVDVKCSMSLLQLDLDAKAIEERRVRRALIDAICQRVPTGAGRGQRCVAKSRRLSREISEQAVIEGASEEVCREIGIPVEWAERCEDAAHVGHDGTQEAVASRWDKILFAGRMKNLPEKLKQLGSYGGGNHFGECEVVKVADTDWARNAAKVFGLSDGQVAFFSHCGSRGFGNILATQQFRTLEEYFRRWSIPLPGGDPKLVYAPLGTPEADDYLDDMALGANFATVNHLLINALALEAFREVFPGVQGRLVYFISHNIARREPLDDKMVWVHRKGATRAFPAGHPSLKSTPFATTGHPILLPGNPRDGSVVMAALPGAERSCYSVNHGAGRALGRNAAIRQLDQKTIDTELDAADILTNCRRYPRDEAPAAYKNFSEVLRSVKEAGLADEVARLHARFVIKDADTADD